ncbi:RNA-splicing ligase RtcB [Prosthecochloris sp. GSB1]|uniref:RtcB family protein n=1 Tax=Prosthecochloris sp. GSB1 TaxID=281093 RepID=UPI000B8CD27C|nr:RtcB family protein [Prosthecochloris sp. GSB1]ASQ90062.1 RNA-splicing ligase RtcB [Prosthecochloris sp. GSB1]
MTEPGFSRDSLRRIHDRLWEIPPDRVKGMLVPARFYASGAMLDQILSDRSLQQLVHVAMLPGIQRYALAMPDIHEGYGFPIGGVAAFDPEEGVISPGGIGYDINCGVRLLRSGVSHEDIRGRIQALADALYRSVPSGVGHGNRIRFGESELSSVLSEGAAAMIGFGYGKPEDLAGLESDGCTEQADPRALSRRARERGMDQLGTLGAGNHFIEVDRVGEVYDENAAALLGLFRGSVVIQVHTGSRGLGHQIASDYLKLMGEAMSRYDIRVPDRELACVPFVSEEGQEYFQAMNAAANFARANRQLITWEIRRGWERTVSADLPDVVCDICHNIASLERHGGRELLVHRKGATRAFPGRPVIVPGSMGTGSFLLIGSEHSLDEAFGSCCHGSGRRMSRSRARKTVHAGQLKQSLESSGIVVRAGSMKGLAEEAPGAYKDIHDVIGTVTAAGLASKVAFLEPLAVIKG